MNIPECAVFTVVTGTGTQEEHTFSLFADGRIEGFRQPAVVINRYPTMLAQEIETVRSTQ